MDGIKGINIPLRFDHSLACGPGERLQQSVSANPIIRSQPIPLFDVTGQGMGQCLQYLHPFFE